MNRLLKIGFVNVGHWTLTNNILQYHLVTNQTSRNVLYTFVSNGEIKYIGKTTMELTKRMYGYKQPGPSQTTNIRVNEKIINLLRDEKPVDIFILADNGLLKYGDFKINLSAGLEDTLIYEISPDWNYSGKSKLIEEKESDNEKLIIINTKMETENQLRETIAIKLGIAYYNQGFFNISQQYSEKIGADKAILNLQLGNDSTNIIEGYINRTANTNGTPRIMGGKTLTDWIQKNYEQNDIMKVDILTELLMKLNEKVKK